MRTLLLALGFLFFATLASACGGRAPAPMTHAAADESTDAPIALTTAARGPLGQPPPPLVLVAGGPQLRAAPKGGQP